MSEIEKRLRDARRETPAVDVDAAWQRLSDRLADTALPARPAHRSGRTRRGGLMPVLAAAAAVAVIASGVAVAGALLDRPRVVHPEGPAAAPTPSTSSTQGAPFSSTAGTRTGPVLPTPPPCSVYNAPYNLTWPARLPGNLTRIPAARSEDLHRPGRLPSCTATRGRVQLWAALWNASAAIDTGRTTFMTPKDRLSNGYRFVGYRYHTFSPRKVTVSITLVDQGRMYELSMQVQLVSSARGEWSGRWSPDKPPQPQRITNSSGYLPIPPA